MRTFLESAHLALQYKGGKCNFLKIINFYSIPFSAPESPVCKLISLSNYSTKRPAWNIYAEYSKTPQLFFSSVGFYWRRRITLFLIHPLILSSLRFVKYLTSLYLHTNFSWNVNKTWQEIWKRTRLIWRK